MTRISSAQRGLNAFIDQIVNARGDIAAAAGSSTTGAFDAHLATFNPNSGGKSKPEDSNTALLKNPNGDTAAGQKDPTDGLSTFTLKNAVGEPSSNQTDPADPISALFAALKTEDQTTNQNAVVSNTNSATKLAAPNQASVQSQTTADSQISAQTDTPLSTLLSLANKADPTSEQSPPLQSRFGTQKPGAVATADVKRAADVKRTADASRRQDQTSGSSSDIAASAQVSIAAVAAALTPQNTAPAPIARNSAPSSGTSVNAPTLRPERANAPASSALPLDNTQISSDAVSSSSQSESLELFGGSSGSGEASAQPIKMTLSSIQAETHFAPVQQLSPTQQIVDLVASAAGTGPAADVSDGTEGAAASSQTPDITSATATSLAASPVKTLTLSLEPDALGTVTITMRLVNASLELKVEAEKPETTSLIEKDKDNLSDKLQSLGYSVDSMVVKTAAAQGSNLDPSNDQTAAGQGQQAANDASSSGASQNGGRSAQEQSQPQSNGQMGGGSGQEAASAPSDRSVGDGIYV